ncbi:MAG TPA: hypothetical protein VGG19_00265, partial [Tepidisphaeraceae bacterium]
GNELLVQLLSDYPVSGENYRTNQHTVDRALAVLQQDFIHLGVSPDRPAAVDSPRGEFVGYLMLDALIGNTDRHHENWGVIVIRIAGSTLVEAELAPSFDHASCLGRELADVDRARRLSKSPNDPKIQTYLSKMDSRWYLNPGDRKRMTPIAAFRHAALRMPDAAAAWLARIERITPEFVDNLLAAMPASMSKEARQFARFMLLFNASQLCGKPFKP